MTHSIGNQNRQTSFSDISASTPQQAKIYEDQSASLLVWVRKKLQNFINKNPVAEDLIRINKSYKNLSKVLDTMSNEPTVKMAPLPKKSAFNKKLLRLCKENKTTNQIEPPFKWKVEPSSEDSSYNVLKDDEDVPRCKFNWKEASQLEEIPLRTAMQMKDAEEEEEGIADLEEKAGKVFFDSSVYTESASRIRESCIVNNNNIEPLTREKNAQASSDDISSEKDLERLYTESKPAIERAKFYKKQCVFSLAYMCKKIKDFINKNPVAEDQIRANKHNYENILKVLSVISTENPLEYTHEKIEEFIEKRLGAKDCIYQMVSSLPKLLTDQIRVSQGWEKWKIHPFVQDDSYSTNLMVDEKGLPRYKYNGEEASQLEEILPKTAVEMKVLEEEKKLPELDEDARKILRRVFWYTQMAKRELEPFLLPLKNLEESSPIKKEAERLYQKIQSESNNLT